MATATVGQSAVTRHSRQRTHVAIVPAKLHSSRCPNKNWAPFADGMNLVDWTLSTIPRDVIGRVILSTDNEAYRPATGCEVHSRDATLATVDADVQDVVRLLIAQYELHDDYVWLLNPTSPFRQIEDFERIGGLIDATGCPAVISVSPISPFVWKNNNPLFDTAGRRCNTQDATDEYATENGAFYVFHAGTFLKHGSWYVPGLHRYVQAEATSRLDIDTPDDLHLARTVAAAQREPISSTGDTIRCETLAIESIVAPPVPSHLELLARHAGRYTDAARCLRLGPRDRVLDASCGMGYGSHLLAQQAGEVVGLDVNEDYLTAAGRLFASSHVQFGTYAAYFKEAREPFDKIVCIETYEHLSRAQNDAFIEQLLRALVINGDMFLTFPIGEDGPSESNPHHLNEPSLGTVHRQFNGRFGDIDYRVSQRRDSFGRCGPYASVTLRGYRGDVPC